MPQALSRPWRSWTVTTRVTALAAVSTTVVLIVGVLVVGAVLRSSLLQEARVSALQRADSVAGRLLEGTLSVEQALDEAALHPSELQLVTPDGQVHVADYSYLPSTALVPPPGDEGPTVAQVADVGGYQVPHLVVAESVGTGGGSTTVIVAAPVEIELGVAARTQRLLAAVAVLAVSAAALLAWLAVRSALRPVTRIVDDVEAISDTGQDRRVQVPAGRDEVARLAVTMNGMLERLARSDRARRRFVSDASHELRSPVSTLLTQLETAPGAGGGRGEAGAPGDAALVDRQLMRAEILRLGRLVDDLLLAAKSDARGLDLDLRTVDVDDLVLQEARRLRAVSAHEVGVSLEAAQVRADPRRLGQVLRNLLDNADRHSTAWVRVSVEARPGRVLVHVDNAGEPVPESQRELVFERFARLDEARSRDRGGSGLGLAIARMLTLAHGGTLVAGVVPPDAEGAGACRFTLELARIDDDVEAGSPGAGAGRVEE